MKYYDLMKLIETYELYSKVAVVSVEDKYTIFLRILWLGKTVEMLKPDEAEIIVGVARF